MNAFGPRYSALIVSATILSMAAGCVRREVSRVEVPQDPVQQEAMKAATNLPSQFTIITPPAAAGDCPSRLRDAGLGTLLTLRRSTLRAVTDSAATSYRAYGDYSAEPHGRYGEERGEGLRIDCARLRALGIVLL
jgi:hypothetical protein